MFQVQELEVTLSTDASGDVTAYTPPNITGPGIIRAIKYEYGNLANTLDLTITGEKSALPILSYTNVPAADAWFYPVAAANKAADGSASSLTEVPVFILNERIKIVGAQGGASKAGTITFYIER